MTLVAITAIFAAYLNGLRSVGWEGNAQLARLGFSASLALRVGLGWIGSVLEVFSDEDTVKRLFETMNDGPLAKPLDDVLEDYAHLITYALARGDEARQLLPILWQGGA